MHRWRLCSMALVTFVLTSAAGFATAQEDGADKENGKPEQKYLDTKQQARELVDRFMGKLAGGDIAGAFEDVGPYYAFNPKELERGVQKPFADSQETIGKRFGKPLEQVYLRENGARDFLYSVEHALKYERHAMHWRFIFYKARDRWVLTGLHYSDKAELFLD